MSKSKKTAPFLVAMTIFLFYLGIYLITPEIYQTIKVKQYNQTFDTFTTTLSTTNDMSSSAHQYAINNDAMVTISNSQNQVVIQTPYIKEIRSYKNNAMVSTMSGYDYEISASYSFKTLSDLNTILILLLPILGIVTFLGYFVLIGNQKPVETIDKAFLQATNEMLQFRPKARIKVPNGKSNKQKLANNINDLYTLLLDKQSLLEKKTDDYNLLLSQSKQTVTSIQDNRQEDIQAILRIVKGMILNQGEYKNHSIHLMDVKLRLEYLLETKKQNKPLSNQVHEAFIETLKNYELLLGQKQVAITYDLTKDFKAPIDSLLFTQAIAHMMSFIKDQCDENSIVRVSQKNYDIMISYQGACLTKESIKTVETKDENIKACYGYVKQMKLFIDYTPTEKKDGMQFTFHF